jgi:hypothetical protein
MKNRAYYLTVFSIALASAPFLVLRAEEETSPTGPFQRDLALLEAVIDNSLNLAAEDDALKRARLSYRLSEVFVAELHAAAQHHDAERLTALSAHVRALLTRGIVFNVLEARAQFPPPSPGAQELSRFGSQIGAALRKDEYEWEQLPRDPAGATDRVRAHLQRGYAEVERALKGPLAAPP